MATYDLVQLYDNVVHDRLPLSREAGYLQSGVVVFDLKAVREERIFKDTIKFALDYPEKCVLVEQDALNAVLNGRWQVMDWRWNVLHFFVENMPRPHFIRHITGSKPWGPTKWGIEKSIVRQWRNDLAESPWPHRYAANRDGWMKTYVRPITMSLERPMKNLIHAASENTHGRIARYLRRLPSVLATIDEAAREGRLGKAL